MEIGTAHHHMTERDEEEFVAPAVSYQEQPAAPKLASTVNNDPKQVDYLSATPEQIDALDELLLQMMHNLM